MNPKDLLINILETFGFPVRLQGTLNETEEYPDTFFTFWNNKSEDGNHYDNNPISYIWDFDVNDYSTDPEQVESLQLRAKEALMNRGFIIDGKGYDIASDEPTHTGRGMHVLFIEKEERS